MQQVQDQHKVKVSDMSAATPRDKRSGDKQSPVSESAKQFSQMATGGQPLKPHVTVHQRAGIPPPPSFPRNIPGPKGHPPIMGDYEAFGSAIQRQAAHSLAGSSHTIRRHSNSNSNSGSPSNSHSPNCSVYGNNLSGYGNHLNVPGAHPSPNGITAGYPINSPAPVPGAPAPVEIWSQPANVPLFDADGNLARPEVQGFVYEKSNSNQPQAKHFDEHGNVIGKNTQHVDAFGQPIDKSKRRLDDKGRPIDEKGRVLDETGKPVDWKKSESLIPPLKSETKDPGTSATKTMAGMPPGTPGMPAGKKQRSKKELQKKAEQEKMRELQARVNAEVHSTQAQDSTLPLTERAAEALKFVTDKVEAKFHQYKKEHYQPSA